MASIAQLLALVGAVVTFKAVYDLAAFVSLYWRSNGYRKYLHSSSSYALITGATDGIGKASEDVRY